MRLSFGNGKRNSWGDQIHFMAGSAHGAVLRAYLQHKETAMTALESFEVVARRYCVDPDDEPDVTTVSIGAFLKGADPKRVFIYLRSLDIQIHELRDILQVNDLADEEEISAEICAEGILLGHSTDGWFLLVTE